MNAEPTMQLALRWGHVAVRTHYILHCRLRELPVRATQHRGHSKDLQYVRAGCGRPVRVCLRDQLPVTPVLPRRRTTGVLLSLIHIFGQLVIHCVVGGRVGHFSWKSKTFTFSGLLTGGTCT